jgi:hypothetical protein
VFTVHQYIFNVFVSSKWYDWWYKVDNLERENLLQYSTRKQNNRVPLVITYSKALPNIHDILRKNMKILNQSDKMKKVFNQPQYITPTLLQFIFTWIINICPPLSSNVVDSNKYLHNAQFFPTKSTEKWKNHCGLKNLRYMNR